MAGIKGKSGGARTNTGGARPNTGGKRPGAGRPRGGNKEALARLTAGQVVVAPVSPAGAPAPAASATPPALVFEDAESYLRGVVMGITPADPTRVAAARCLIQYEKKRQRTRLASPTPGQMAAKEARAPAIDFEAKAAEIRARHAQKKGNP